MSHREIQDLIPVYALGALDPVEAEQVERHLGTGCDVCRALLIECESVAADLAHLLPVTDPNPARRRELFERVEADARSNAAAGSTPSKGPATRRADTRWSSVGVPLALAASVLVALGLGIQLAGERATTARLQSEQTASAQTLALAQADKKKAQEALSRAQNDHAVTGAELARTRTELEQRLAQAQAMLDAITAPDTKTVSLTGKGGGAQARATAFLDASKGQLLLLVNGLPAAKPGRTYQLWVIVEGKPVSLGIFDVGEQGRARMTTEKLPELRGPVTVAVTEEPAGGVPQPTGEMVLVGS